MELGGRISIYEACVSDFLLIHEALQDMGIIWWPLFDKKFNPPKSKYVDTKKHAQTIFFGLSSPTVLVTWKSDFLLSSLKMV